MIVLSVPFEYTRRTILTLTLGLVFFILSASYAYAATVIVSPASGTYTSGQSFTATIQVNPQGKSINAVEAKLSFDNTKLSVVSVSKTGSAFSLWTTEPKFSNSAGTIDFGGGSPSPFSSISTIMTVTFRATAEGSADVKVVSASALAADGLGTDVYSGSTNATYTIGAAATTPTPTETTKQPEKETDDTSNAAITFGDPPRAPEVGSQTFLDPELWYPTKSGVFVWELPFDIDSLALDIATTADAEPKTVYDPPIEEFVTNDEILHDGIQYLTIQFHNQVGWGAILHRMVKVDTIPPEPFIVKVQTGNTSSAFPLLSFEAEDLTSGIARYEMTIADAEPIAVTPDEAKLGYLLKDLEDGTYTVRVKAYDYAGNMTEASVPVLITAGWHPPLEVVVTTSVWDLFKGKNLAILLLILAVIALLAYIYLEKRRGKLREEKLRRETKEVQDQMEKIFSALRDEIYDQISGITKRARMSKRERETVETLNQALEVSETLIEKEIGDVKQILK